MQLQHKQVAGSTRRLGRRVQGPLVSLGTTVPLHLAGPSRSARPARSSNVIQPVSFLPAEAKPGSHGPVKKAQVQYDQRPALARLEPKGSVAAIILVRAVCRVCAPMPRMACPSVCPCYNLLRSSNSCH